MQSSTEQKICLLKWRSIKNVKPILSTSSSVHTADMLTGLSTLCALNWHGHRQNAIGDVLIKCHHCRQCFQLKLKIHSRPNVFIRCRNSSASVLNIFFFILSTCNIMCEMLQSACAMVKQFCLVHDYIRKSRGMQKVPCEWVWYGVTVVKRVSSPVKPVKFTQFLQLQIRVMGVSSSNPICCKQVQSLDRC